VQALFSVGALVLAQAAGAGGARVPAVLPVDCAAAAGARLSAWDRARSPQVPRYCDLMAQAEARLLREPKRADEAAQAAAALVAGQVAPLVLRARAAVQSGQFAEALALFDEAAAVDASALDEPRALLARAVALRETGADARAIAAYRALIPRLDGLPDREERTRAQIDAGVALMIEGPGSLEPAVAVLRAAASQGSLALRSLARACLSLALDRAGAKAEAQALAAEAQRSGATATLERKGSAAVLGWRIEALAVAAVLREAAGNGGAAWEAYAARAPAVWAAHARGRVAEAKRAPGRRSKGR
jgi:tetratricopeptide (TPR) repeat protein